MLLFAGARLQRVPFHSYGLFIIQIRNGAPAAFLNYILFDKNYKVMNMGWSAVPATANFAKQKVSIPTINVAEAGYLFTYLSYEDQSNNFVYFDDYKVTYTPTNIVQYNEYYPYGLQTASSWTRDNATANNFLGNGGTELNTTSGLYDLEYRNYDPALARMNQVDPMADKYASYTPYNYSFNAPSNFNDVNGADPSPGEKDFVKRQPMGQFVTGNDFSRLFRGGSQTAMFDRGWSPSRNSMSYEAFARADAYFSSSAQVDPSNYGNFLAAGRSGSINLNGNSASVLYLQIGAQVAIDRNGNPISGSERGYNVFYNESIDLKFGASTSAVRKSEFWVGNGMGINAYSPHEMTNEDAVMMIAATTGVAAIELGGVALLNHFASLSLKSVGRNLSFNALIQGVTKQDASKFDIIDFFLAGVGGDKWGQLVTGGLGGLFDWEPRKGGFISPFSKDGFQLGADVGTGLAFGASGMGLAKYLSPAWESAGGFLNQLFGDGLGEALTIKNK